MSDRSAQVAIVDYGMGNLFSVRQACERVGLQAAITDSPAAVEAADAILLPGVGAYGDAMQALRERGLADVLQRSARSGKVVIGICLGMQLLMEESEEFGRHDGLGLLPGIVRRFPLRSTDGGSLLKVPQVGWNRIWFESGESADASPAAPLFDQVSSGAFVYFVHSYYVEPARREHIIATSRYGGVTFCAGIRHDNIVGWQFHPERSGSVGLRLYRNVARLIAEKRLAVDA